MSESVIRYLDSPEIDAVKWNQCVNSGVLGIPQLCYAQFEYLNAICENQWGALVVYDSNLSAYQNVMPLPYRKKWGCLYYIYQPYFCQQLGVFGKHTDYREDDFIGEIPKRLLRLHMNVHGGIGIPKKSSKRTNYILPPPHIPEETFNKDALKNLRKLHKQSIDYVKTTEYQLILTVYDEAWGETSGFEWFNDYSAFFNALKNTHPDRIYAVLVRESVTKETLGGAIFLHSGIENTKSHRLHYVCGGAVGKGRDWGVVHGIIEHVCIAFPQSIIDFEGSNIESVANFYRKFGPVDEPYYSININYRL
jgi:hypothetical protein